MRPSDRVRWPGFGRDLRCPVCEGGHVAIRAPDVLTGISTGDPDIGRSGPRSGEDIVERHVPHGDGASKIPLGRIERAGNCRGSLAPNIHRPVDA